MGQTMSLSKILISSPNCQHMNLQSEVISWKKQRSNREGKTKMISRGYGGHPKKMNFVKKEGTWNY
ncbi:hypothetical protein DsansV1_C07g0074201 [Dioscorea sansibarensis]